MAEFPKKYQPQQREEHWQKYWLDSGIYQWDKEASRSDSYVIDTPPPTVSGELHMGHVFSYTQADFIARYQRMKGKSVFYPMGFDDNGLPTERLVEKKRKIRAVDMSREDFIKACMEISSEARVEYRKLFETTALSVDWTQEYHTISEHSRRLSQMSFIDLFQKEKAYRKLQPMLWDPVDQTAIAQAEIVDKELPSHFSDIAFEIDGADNPVIIGTTRPEMIGACVALFYHPEDERYQHLKGKYALTPLFNIKVPVLEDDTVEPEKGTGIMMCCTFGDEADIEKWQNHDLPLRIILNKYGKIDFSLLEDIQIENEKLQGLKAAKAREEILKMLDDSGALKKSEPITHAVKCAERSGAPLEIIPTYQWFIKVLDQKQELKAKNDSCNWKPGWMKARMDQWIEGLSWDWCISRQRYFGVPFPIWYSKREGEEGKIIVADISSLPINPMTDLPEGYEPHEVEAEFDVMDTWATSAITPQLASGAISEDMAEDIDRHRQLFPADLRPQAHDIIRTWAFYTIVKAHLHEDSVPWHNLMVSGFCLAADKTKMSKSKGNVTTPEKLLAEKGSDVVRYWASTSKLGTDTALSTETMKIGDKLVKKIFNASKFASMQVEPLAELQKSDAKTSIDSGEISEVLDLWMISRINHAIQESAKAFEIYEYADARAAIENVFWNDFCDNYLELVKSRSYGNHGQKEQLSACYTIYYCLNALLKLFAPFVPHITEEVFSLIYEQEFMEKGSIHSQGMFPDAGLFPKNDEMQNAGIQIVKILEAVRKDKSEKNLSIKAPLKEMRIFADNDDVIHLLQKADIDLKAATSSENITWHSSSSGESAAIDIDGEYKMQLLYAEAEEVA